MIVAIFILCAFSVLLCFACLVEGAKADESAKYSYQEFLKQRATHK